MRKLGEFILEKMNERKLVYADFEKFGISGTTVNNLTLGKTKKLPRIETLQSLSKALRVDLQTLIDLANNKEVNIPEIDDEITEKPIYNKQVQGHFDVYSSKDHIRLPYYPQGVPCGVTRIVFDDIEESIIYPKRLAEGADFVVRANGNSMQAAGIVDGTHLLVKKQSHFAKNGDIMIINIIDDGVVCRKVYYDYISKIYTLKAGHPDFADDTKTPAEISFVGKVVRMITEA